MKKPPILTGVIALCLVGLLTGMAYAAITVYNGWRISFNVPPETTTLKYFDIFANTGYKLTLLTEHDKLVIVKVDKIDRTDDGENAGIDRLIYNADWLLATSISGDRRIKVELLKGNKILLNVKTNTQVGGYIW